MLWFDVAGGDKAAIALMDNVKRPWTLCENLGATESIITACAVMTHANMVREDRLKVCLPLRASLWHIVSCVALWG